MNPKDICTARHPSYPANAKLCEFYELIASADPNWSLKRNPLAIASSNRSKALFGESTFLTQHSLEANDSFVRRASRAAVVDVCSPGLSLYCGTVGQPDAVSFDVAPDWAEIIDNFDAQGSDFCSFWSAARQSAAICGVSYVLVDSPKANGPIVTEADAIQNGVRPFARLIRSRDMLNWRLDDNGEPVECLFRLSPEPSGSILEASGKVTVQYRFWSRSNWVVFEENGEEINVIDQGDNPIGKVPVTPLYHQRGDSPWSGISLLKNASKFQLLLSNWLSDFGQTLENQSFSQAVLKSANTPAELGFGSSVVMTLRPDSTDSKESFEYVTPQAQALESGWKAFIDILRMTLRSFGVASDPLVDAGRAESGEAKAWRWAEISKRMVTMAICEQTCVDAVMDLMAAFRGEADFSGNIAIATSFDKVVLADSIDSAIKMMSLALPPTAKKELLKGLLSEALPDLSPDVTSQINKELDMIPAQAAAAAPFQAPADAMPMK